VSFVIVSSVAIARGEDAPLVGQQKNRQFPRIKAGVKQKVKVATVAERRKRCAIVFQKITSLK